MNEQHSSECLERVRVWKQELSAFLEKWPDCCQHCFATGLIYICDDEDDFCEECIYAEKCPRCRQDFVYQDHTNRCAHCGWETGEDYLTWPPTCECLEVTQEAIS